MIQLLTVPIFTFFDIVPALQSDGWEHANSINSFHVDKNYDPFTLLYYHPIGIHDSVDLIMVSNSTLSFITVKNVSEQAKGKGLKV